MYWLTGYDTFGYCFFQCLVLRADGRLTLLTRAPDLRQAQHTSVIEDIRIWVDRDGAEPGRASCARCWTSWACAASGWASSTTPTG